MRENLSPQVGRLCLGLLLVHGSLLTVCAQSNLLYNGSFERANEGWDFSGGLAINQTISADGAMNVGVDFSLWQDVHTVPGREYVLKFAIENALPVVKWGGALCTNFNFLPGTNFYWHYVYCYVTAVTNLTRLQFDDTLPSGYTTPLDDVRLGWLYEPISFKAQPDSQSTVVGGLAVFSVAADAAPPLSYQWHRNDQPLADATNRVLILTNVQRQDAGSYSVLVSNVAGVQVSSNAWLAVEELPREPVIAAQPQSHTLPAGYADVLWVVALGEAPLRYQWLLDGTPLLQATNVALQFEAVQPTNQGSYEVIVSNDSGSVRSLPATLIVTNALGGGQVTFSNFRAYGGPPMYAPVFDVDGLTKPAGTNFAAQLYAGATPEVLRAVGPPVGFRPPGTFAGTFRTVPRTVSDVSAPNRVFVQARVWETVWGTSYEEARTRGGKFGFSPVSSLLTSGNTTTPPFTPLFSFNLRAGLPYYTRGRIQRGERLEDGTLQWILTGEPGVRYLVEKRYPPHNWMPLLVVTNETGTVTFTDPEQSNQSHAFYRSRILD